MPGDSLQVDGGWVDGRNMGRCAGALGVVLDAGSSCADPWVADGGMLVGGIVGLTCCPGYHPSREVGRVELHRIPGQLLPCGARSEKLRRPTDRRLGLKFRNVARADETPMSAIAGRIREGGGLFRHVAGQRPHEPAASTVRSREHQHKRESIPSRCRLQRTSNRRGRPSRAGRTPPAARRPGAPAAQTGGGRRIHVVGGEVDCSRNGSIAGQYGLPTVGRQGRRSERSERMNERLVIIIIFA